jgi:hypothetical protein
MLLHLISTHIMENLNNIPDNFHAVEQVQQEIVLLHMLMT